MTDLLQLIKELVKSEELSKTVHTFFDIVIAKLTGKSIKVFEAESDI